MELHNLADDLGYRVYSNMGRAPFKKLRKGMFVMGRIVPIHPATDAWLVSGNFIVQPKSMRRTIARKTVQLVMNDPESLRRNPSLLQRAWEVQSEQRAEFIAQVGSDLVVLSPLEAQEALREHYQRLQRNAADRTDQSKKRAARRASANQPTAEELAQLPDDLLEADSVALVYDETEGLCFFRDFGHLDALFADPGLASDDTYLGRLQHYLNDESVSPLAIRRLVQRHPDGADPVFRALLKKNKFSWSRDGEKLLRRHKKGYFDNESALASP